MIDHKATFKASIRCWTRLVRAIEALPDSDRKQAELDAIFEQDWMKRPVDIL